MRLPLALLLVGCKAREPAPPPVVPAVVAPVVAPVDGASSPAVSAPDAGVVATGVISCRDVAHHVASLCVAPPKEPCRATDHAGCGEDMCDQRFSEALERCNDDPPSPREVACLLAASSESAAAACVHD